MIDYLLTLKSSSKILVSPPRLWPSLTWMLAHLIVLRYLSCPSFRLIPTLSFRVSFLTALVPGDYSPSLYFITHIFNTHLGLSILLIFYGFMYGVSSEETSQGGILMLLPLCGPRALGYKWTCIVFVDEVSWLYWHFKMACLQL